MSDCNCVARVPGDVCFVADGSQTPLPDTSVATELKVAASTAQCEEATATFADHCPEAGLVANLAHRRFAYQERAVLRKCAVRLSPERIYLCSRWCKEYARCPVFWNRKIAQVESGKRTRVAADFQNRVRTKVTVMCWNSVIFLTMSVRLRGL